MWSFRKLAPATLLAICAISVQAQQPSRRVAFEVVAVDSSGNPVPDLTPSDFTVFDNGTRQTTVSVHLNQSAEARPLVILFDLLNSNLNTRGPIWDAMKTMLAHLPANGPFYLYLLTENGSLYAVHGVDAPEGGSWIEDSGHLLDTAMRDTAQLRPQDLRASSVIALPRRFETTTKALSELGQRMGVLHGRKDLLWVTYGFPSSIRLAGQGWWDGSPLLRQLGGQFAESGITIYTADPGINLATGILDRDSLDILTGATGGHPFQSIALDQVVARMEADSRTNYSIEYQPPARNWDGKYHKLRVKVARKGVRLQNENGYFAVGS